MTQGQAIREKAKLLRRNPNYVFLANALLRKDIRIIALVGGTRSGKTYNTIECLCDFAYAKRNIGTVSLVRETSASLANSLERQFLEITTKKNYYRDDKWHATKREMMLEQTLFEIFGADNPQKLRGSERDVLFANEVNGFKYFSFNELALRTKHKIIIDFNPTILQNHFIYTEILTRPDCLVFNSNYIDNIDHLPESQVREIETLKITNPERWRTMGLGERAQVQGAIYPHWEIGNYMPHDNEICVMDLGYNDPTTASLLSRGYSPEHGREVYYAKNIYYERFKDPNQVIADLKQLGVDGKQIVCDIAPQIVATFRNAGLNVIDAVKGTSRFTKINAVKLFQSEMVIMDRNSVHLHTEQAAYAWDFNEAQNLFIDKLVDGNDHILDALLYGFMTRFANRADPQPNILTPYSKKFAI